MARGKRPDSLCGRLIFEIIPLMVLLGLLGWYIDSRLYPAIEAIAEHQARGYAAQLVNSAMSSELKENLPSYGEIIALTYGNSGEITSVQANMAAIGKLQTSLAEKIISQIETQQSREIKIPVGTISGSPILTGRGPDIKIKLIPVGSMQTQLEHRFTSAGINQTLHQIMLIVELNIETILPGRVHTTHSTAGYSIAETVIIGEVPHGYTQINGDDSPFISKINDYAA